MRGLYGCTHDKKDDWPLCCLSVKAVLRRVCLPNRSVDLSVYWHGHLSETVGPGLRHVTPAYVQSLKGD